MAHIEFSPQHRPVLPLGDYSIELKPVLKVDGVDKKAEIPASVLQSFVISGERFALQPADIVAVFPPDGSIGDHSNVLPHLILQRSSLPWERTADPSDPKETALPWLALLVFDETAVELPVTSTLTLSQLKTPQPGQPTADGAGIQGPAGTFPAILESTSADIAGTGKLKLETGQSLDEKITVIDVKANVLARMMPGRVDLAWMAHVRQSVDGPDRGEERAILMANRMPARGGRSTVHLVSLENQFGPSGFYTPLSLHAPDTQLVRLVSLKSWSFSCIEAYKVSSTFVAALKKGGITIDNAKEKTLLQIGEVTGTEEFLNQVKTVLGDQVTTANKDLILRSATHETFLGLLQHLDRSPAALRLPKPAGLPDVAEKMLATGATALPHRFRNGNQLVSWYHGPLVPAIANIALHGRPDLVTASFSSMSNWINLLKSPGSDVLATWLAGKLSPDTQAAVRQPNAADAPITVKILLRDLNHLLMTETLYDASRFSKPLPADLLALTTQSRTGEALFQLNRKLLEFAYPKLVMPAKFAFPITTSDEVLVYNPVTGMFDVSYAAAWELGRLMALRDKKFSIELFNWKRSMAQNLKSAEQQAFAHLPFSSNTAGSPATFPQTLQDWFDQLGTLANIPFNYLVPDEKMLPSESIRFFKMDPFWMDCLIDGAFSLGRTGTTEQALDAIHLENADLQPDQDISGFLLRSDLVSGWPDLQVKSYDQVVTDDKDPAPGIHTLVPFVVRRLSPGIMLWLFRGTVKTVDIFQKPEMLHFGFDQMDDNTFEKPLRNNDGTDLFVNKKQVALSVKNANGKPVYWRDDAWYRCLNVNVLADQIKATLAAQGQATSTFTSAEFALQMIEGATRVRFRLG